MLFDYSELLTAQMEQAKAMFEYDVYGLSLGVILSSVLGFLGLSFILSGPRERGIFGRVLDLFAVVFAIAFLLVCMAGGLYIGNDYGMMGVGGFAGLMLFAGVFYAWFSFQTSRKNARAREQLATYLKYKNKKR